MPALLLFEYVIALFEIDIARDMKAKCAADEVPEGFHACTIHYVVLQGKDYEKILSHHAAGHRNAGRSGKSRP